MNPDSNVAQQAFNRVNQTIYLVRSMNTPGIQDITIIRTVHNITSEANYEFGVINLNGNPVQVFRTTDYSPNEWDCMK